jgi:hypothetical protein
MKWDCIRVLRSFALCFDLSFLYIFSNFIHHQTIFILNVYLNKVFADVI